VADPRPPQRRELEIDPRFFASEVGRVGACTLSLVILAEFGTELLKMAHGPSWIKRIFIFATNFSMG
jgi:hypothetical protein